MDKNTADEAAASFNKGFNCAQSVFVTFCEELGMDRELGLRVSCGLGGGMGRIQETCGALTGAILVAGMKYGKVLPEDDQAKETTYTLVRKLTGRFIELHGTSNCRELQGVNLLTSDKQVITEKHTTVCLELVKSAARLVEELI